MVAIHKNLETFSEKIRKFSYIVHSFVLSVSLNAFGEHIVSLPNA